MFRCGERVYLKGDPRHIGVVVATLSTVTIRVRWEDLGAKEDLDFRDVRRWKDLPQ